MREILEKLNKVKDVILHEKANAKLRLFVLIQRTDLEDKWDILLSADWLEKTNSQKDLTYLIKKLKAEFGEHLDFLSRIIVAIPQESFMKRFAKAIIKEKQDAESEMTNLIVSADFTAKHLFVIAIDFKGIDLENLQGINEGPLGVQEISDF